MKYRVHYMNGLIPSNFHLVLWELVHILYVPEDGQQGTLVLMPR